MNANVPNGPFSTALRTVTAGHQGAFILGGSGRLWGVPAFESKGTGDYFAGGETAGAWSCPLTLFSAKIKNECSSIPTPPICPHGLDRDNKGVKFVSRMQDVLLAGHGNCWCPQAICSIAPGQIKYSHAPLNDVSVNDGQHIRRWPHKIIILQYYNTYHCVTIAYSIQYSNMLYRFVA